MTTLRQLAFSGGITGGHLFPGLAVAAAIQSAHPQVQITFAGRGAPWERDQVATAGHEYLALPCQAWPRRPWRWPRFVFDQVAGLQQARRWLRSRQVDAVIGLGGYSSTPLALAASEVGCPLILLEQNVRPGRATRWLAPRARYVCAAFAESRDWLPIDDAAFRVTGNPVRAAFQRRTVNEPTNLRARQLVVLGGSQGSAELNQIVPAALARLPQATDWKILHQSGVAGKPLVEAAYQAAGLACEVVAFSNNLPAQLQNADLVVCRAGGTTLAELAIAGVAAIVCPWADAADDHQRYNARALATAGACSTIDLHTASAPAVTLAAEIAELMIDTRRRRTMVEQLRRYARPTAAVEIANLIERTVGSRDQSQRLLAT